MFVFQGLPAARIRSASAFLVLAIFVALTVVPIATAHAASCGPASITTTRVSAPIVYIDTGISPQLTGSYAGYQIANGGPDIADAWVELDNFAGGIVGLAPNEDGRVHVGPLESGETAFAYFYLAASVETATAQTHDVVVYEGRPDLGTSVCEDGYSLTVEETIKASANKVSTVIAGPNPAVLGGLMTMTVTGQTGQVGAAGSFTTTPAAAPDWPADAYVLVDSQITFEAAGAFNDTLFVTGLGGTNQDYTAVFTFVAAGSTTAPTTVSPVNYIASGRQIKHTDTGSFAALDPIEPADNTTTLAKAAAPTALPASGGVVTYTVTASNSAAIEVVLDDYIDMLPADASFETGSARYEGGAIADPAVSGQTLTFVGIFPVPATGTATLTYDVMFPAVAGSYTNQVTGHVGTTTIDLTADTSDSSPAAATVTIGSPATEADLSLAKADAADPVIEGDNISYTITVTNFGPDSAADVQVVDTLPGGMVLVSAVPEQGSCGHVADTVTCDLGSVSVGSVAVTVVVVAPTPATYTNDASVTTSSTDPVAGNNTGSETTTVEAESHPPLAVDDSGVVGEDSSVVVDVLGNDSDVDGDLDPTSVAVLTGPSNGLVVVDPVSGEVTYTPDLDYAGPDSFTYEVCDLTAPTPLCDSATVTLSVTGINDAPAASDDPAAVVEDGVVTVDVLGNDSDVDGNLDPTSVTVILGPTHGSVVVDPVTGAVTYTPDPDYTGPDSFTYQVCDTSGACDTAMVSVAVTGDADAPTAVDDSGVVGEDSSVVVDVLGNDSDVDGDLDPTSVAVLTGPSNGLVVVDPVSGEVTYTPDLDYAGPDSFTYEVCDLTAPTPLCDSATVTLSVTGINDAPAASDDPAAVVEDGVVTVDVLGNDSDVDGNLDPTSVTVILGPTHGSVVVDPVTGAVTYTPDPDYTGPDSFTYQVCDTSGACDTAMVSVAVTGDADAPTAVDDSTSTVVNTDVVIDVLGNDSDVDGDLDPTSVAVLTGPSNGLVVVDPVSGEVTYTPDLDYAGPDSFTYEVCDLTAPTPLCATATVLVDVDPGVTPPVAVGDGDSVDEDGFVVTDVVGNDSDVDGNLDPGSVTVVAGPVNGSVVVDPVTGAVTYTPDPDFNGSDSYTYQVCDSTVPVPLCDSALVAVTVDPVDDAPVANDDVVATPEDTAVVIDVAGNDTDVDGDLDPGSVTVILGPTHGSVVVDPVSGEVTYTPDLDYSGPDSFTYEICDTSVPTPLCSVGGAVVTTTVVEIDDAPVAVGDGDSVDEDGFVVTDVVGNDSDVDGNLDPGSVTVVAGPVNGSVVVDPVTGAVTYTPDPDFNGSDSYTYQVCDSTVPVPLCDSALVAVTVDPVDDAPVANDDVVATPEDTAVVIDVAGNDTDVDGDLDPGSVTVILGPTHGSVVVDPVSGEVTYTPDLDYSGPDSFTYEICDTSVPTPLCSVGGAVVTTTVVEIDDAPVAVGDGDSVDEDGFVVTDVVGNDSDVDGNLDPGSVTVVAGPVNGSVVVDPVTGAVTYTPDPDFNGSDSYTYQVCDSTVPVPLCDSALVAVTVDPVDDAPVANDDVVATPEDTAVVIDVAGNDTDVDGDLDPGSVTVILGPTHGSVVVDPVSGEVTYTPDLDYSGPDSFTYEICDTSVPTPLCSTAAASVTIGPVNDPPVYEGSTTIAIAIGGTPGPLEFTDPDGHPVTVTIVEGPLPPGLVLNPSGTWSGNATTAGSYPVILRACDDQIPAACSEISLVLAVSLLPVTGIGLRGITLVGVLLVTGGWLTLLEEKRRRLMWRQAFDSG